MSLYKIKIIPIYDRSINNITTTLKYVFFCPEVRMSFMCRHQITVVQVVSVGVMTHKIVKQKGVKA